MGHTKARGGGQARVTLKSAVKANSSREPRSQRLRCTPSRTAFGVFRFPGKTAVRGSRPATVKQGKFYRNRIRGTPGHLITPSGTRASRETEIWTDVPQTAGAWLSPSPAAVTTAGASGQDAVRPLTRTPALERDHQPCCALSLITPPPPDGGARAPGQTSVWVGAASREPSPRPWKTGAIPGLRPGCSPQPSDLRPASALPAPPRVPQEVWSRWWCSVQSAGLRCPHHEILRLGTGQDCEPVRAGPLSESFSVSPTRPGTRADTRGWLNSKFFRHIYQHLPRVRAGFWGDRSE